MSEHETAETVFLIDSKISDLSGPFLNLTAYPVYRTNAGEIRNLLGDGFDAHPLADLQVSAQLDRIASNGDPYGWKVEYRDVFSADLRRAASMVKTLRKVESGLAKIQSELGAPESFPAYLARVAKVLGIKQFGWRLGGGSSLYAENEYRFTDADGMTYRVNELCAKFLDTTERIA